jgi:hypothetical protein
MREFGVTVIEKIAILVAKDDQFTRLMQDDDRSCA